MGQLELAAEGAQDFQDGHSHSYFELLLGLFSQLCPVIPPGSSKCFGYITDPALLFLKMFQSSLMN